MAMKFYLVVAFYLTCNSFCSGTPVVDGVHSEFQPGQQENSACTQDLVSTAVSIKGSSLDAGAQSKMTRPGYTNKSTLLFCQGLANGAQANFWHIEGNQRAPKALIDAKLAQKILLLLKDVLQKFGHHLPLQREIPAALATKEFIGQDKNAAEAAKPLEVLKGFIDSVNDLLLTLFEQCKAMGSKFVSEFYSVIILQQVRSLPASAIGNFLDEFAMQTNGDELQRMVWQVAMSPNFYASVGSTFAINFIKSVNFENIGEDASYYLEQMYLTASRLSPENQKEYIDAVKSTFSVEALKNLGISAATAVVKFGTGIANASGKCLYNLAEKFGGAQKKENEPEVKKPVIKSQLLTILENTTNFQKIPEENLNTTNPQFYLKTVVGSFENILKSGKLATLASDSKSGETMDRKAENSANVALETKDSVTSSEPSEEQTKNAKEFETLIKDVMNGNDAVKRRILMAKTRQIVGDEPLFMIVQHVLASSTGKIFGNIPVDSKNLKNFLSEVFKGLGVEGFVEWASRVLAILYTEFALTSPEWFAEGISNDLLKNIVDKKLLVQASLKLLEQNKIGDEATGRVKKLMQDEELQNLLKTLQDAGDVAEIPSNVLASIKSYMPATPNVAATYETLKTVSRQFATKIGLPSVSILSPWG